MIVLVVVVVIEICLWQSKEGGGGHIVASVCPTCQSSMYGMIGIALNVNIRSWACRKPKAKVTAAELKSKRTFVSSIL